MPQLNMEKVQLVPIEDAEITDWALSQFLDETEKLLMTETAATAQEVLAPDQQTSVNVVQNTGKNIKPSYPVPQIYFQHSNVQIHYNFSG